MIRELFLKMRMHVLLLLVQNFVLKSGIFGTSSCHILIANHEIAHSLIEVRNFMDVSIVRRSNHYISFSYS